MVPLETAAVVSYSLSIVTNAHCAISNHWAAICHQIITLSLSFDTFQKPLTDDVVKSIKMPVLLSLILFYYDCQ